VVYVGVREAKWLGVSEKRERERISSCMGRWCESRVLGFIGFSCAAQCFLCVLPFYPIFNDSFGK
jgi:hypothetical protein